MKILNSSLWVFAVVGVFVYALAPTELLAATEKFGAEAINAHATDLITFLFGPPLKIASALGFAYGMIQCYTMGSATPLYTYGGIGLAGFVAPTVISKLVPVASMLIP